MSISSVAKAHCRRPHGNAMVTPWQLRKSSDKQLTIDALFARTSVRLIKLDFFAYSTKTFQKENEEKRLYYRRVPLLTRVYLPQIFRKRNNILKWCGRQAFSGSCFVVKSASPSAIQDTKWRINANWGMYASDTCQHSRERVEGDEREREDHMRTLVSVEYCDLFFPFISNPMSISFSQNLLLCICNQAYLTWR